MIPPEGEAIIKLVGEERYEEALGVTFKVSREEINLVHLRLVHRFRESAELREALNKAKAVLVGENSTEKGRRLSKIGREEEALPYLKEAVRSRGDALNHHWLGSTLYELSCYEEALPHLEKAIELRGNTADCHWLGSVLVKLGRREEALPHLEKAVKLRGNGLDHHWLGSVLAELGRREEALPHLEKAVKLRGNGLDHHWLRICQEKAARASDRDGQKPSIFSKLGKLFFRG